MLEYRTFAEFEEEAQDLLARYREKRFRVWKVDPSIITETLAYLLAIIYYAWGIRRQLSGVRRDRVDEIVKSYTSEVIGAIESLALPKSIKKEEFEQDLGNAIQAIIRVPLAKRKKSIVLWQNELAKEALRIAKKYWPDANEDLVNYIIQAQMFKLISKSKGGIN